MGALKGSITVRRYQVKGDKPKDQAKIMRGIRAHALIPIDPKSDVERVHGWSCVEDPDDTDLTSNKVMFSGSVCLAVRVDSLRPPSAVVKRLVAQRLRELGRKPNRAEKQAMKDEVKRSLRGRYLPTQKAVDVVWQVEEGKVFFWSHGKHMNELLIDLFYKSFELELVPNGPGQVAGRGSLPPQLGPTPEMVFGFPGMPGRPTAQDMESESEEMIDA